MHIVPFLLLAALNVDPSAAPSGSLTAEPPSPPPVAAPSPYVAPWSLRSAVPSSSARLDDVMALADKTTTDVMFVSGSYAPSKQLAFTLRAGGVGNWPDGAARGLTLVNPALGAVYGARMEDFRIAGWLNAVLPLGMGGGDHPDANVAAANKAGGPARSAMDNTLFAVNYGAVVPGLDAAWIHRGATVQLEATLFQLERMRGEAIEKDAARTNFTSGLFGGYAFGAHLSAGGELRYQRWLSTPASVAKDPTLRDNLSAAIGLRTAFALGGETLKPGISYGRALMGSISDGGYQYVQLDLPIAF